MPETLTIRLSGKEQNTAIVNGFSINGFFVHHPYTDKPAFAALWAVSHSASGMSLGAYFAKKRDAIAFTNEMAAIYDGNCDNEQLIAQFRARGSKPSVCDLAEKYNATY